MPVGPPLPNDRPPAVPVHYKDGAIVHLVKSITAPGPILGAIHQSPSDRVRMAVIEFLEMRLLPIHVEVVTARGPDLLFAELPEGPSVERIRPQAPPSGPLLPQTLLAVEADVLLERI